ncbi:MAG: YkgJ family cysteine cluster protein [Rhodocyclales bacterium]|nr:YkgJ family cysteine cluster protein [Rhodocyclales bacterium]
MSPCQTCGACCASFRVSFPCYEVDVAPGGLVPEALVEPVGQDLVCMRGTASSPSRCVALRGAIGQSVSCAIYEFRPAVCRDFAPLAAVGRGDEACSEARRRHGLARLTPIAA